MKATIAAYESSDRGDVGDKSLTHLRSIQSPELVDMSLAIQALVEGLRAEVERLKALPSFKLSVCKIDKEDEI